MKICYLVGLIFCITVIPALGTEQPKPCRDTPMSQLKMNECAGDELKAARDALDNVHQRIRKQKADDKVFLDRLEAGQRPVVHSAGRRN